MNQPRNYHPNTSNLSIWLSVDPMSDKYPSMSPYNYCANNPVILVDPDGRVINIKGQNGESLVYSPNITYGGSDKFISFVVDAANVMYKSAAGKFVLDKLIKSQKKYSISNEPSSDGNPCATKNGLTMSNDKSYSTFFHEIFHVFQFYSGQGGASAENEVEAYIFEIIVSSDKNVNLPPNTFNITPANLNLSSDERKKQQLYAKAFMSLAYLKPLSSSEFDTKFNDMSNGFLKFSVIGPDYKKLNYKVTLNNRKTNLLKQFYPNK